MPASPTLPMITTPPLTTPTTATNSMYDNFQYNSGGNNNNNNLELQRQLQLQQLQLLQQQPQFQTLQQQLLQQQLLQQQLMLGGYANQSLPPLSPTSTFNDNDRFSDNNSVSRFSNTMEPSLQSGLGITSSSPTLRSHMPTTNQDVIGLYHDSILVKLEKSSSRIQTS
ncbi:15198_t:CDS:2 [Entrophospora sp. SA101]|nr:14963_t:CDS:2 [Entrophospora sp. SA101]CAJ0907762.1 15198_t:CDS:2 [Entrophospora sp. SA101]